MGRPKSLYKVRTVSRLRGLNGYRLNKKKSSHKRLVFVKDEK